MSGSSGLRHWSECPCETCVARGHGLVATQDALSGDPSAAQRLSPQIYAVLQAERISRELGGKRPKVAA